MKLQLEAYYTVGPPGDDADDGYPVAEVEVRVNGVRVGFIPTSLTPSPSLTHEDIIALTVATRLGVVLNGG